MPKFALFARYPVTIESIGDPGHRFEVIGVADGQQDAERMMLSGVDLDWLMVPCFTYKKREGQLIKDAIV